MDMTVITQLYCQLYVTCQLHVSANTISAIIRLDTIIGENYTIYNMILLTPALMVILYHIVHFSPIIVSNLMIAKDSIGRKM